MTTYAASNPTDGSLSTYPVPQFGGGVVNFQYGGYTFSAEPAAADVLNLCYVPACKVVDGFMRGEDIDTGTETLGIDIGWAADTDGFGNLGVVTGDAVTEVKPEVQIWMPLNGTLKLGPVAFTAPTQLLMTFVDDPQAGGTGFIWAGFYYTCNK